MYSKKIIQFAQSFILLPVITISVPFGNIPKTVVDTVPTSQTVFLQKDNNGAGDLVAFNQAIDQKAQILQAKADAIDAYFKAHNMPLQGLGNKMVQEAEKNGLDWRLLAAIAVRESTGGIHDCQNVDHNFFGWGSCKISFKSDEEAIETVAMNLGGNNPNTSSHYSGKTTKEILQEYNPPSVVPTYAKQVMAIMDEIGDNINKENVVNAPILTANI
jgi:hypothetical protein